MILQIFALKKFTSSFAHWGDPQASAGGAAVVGEGEGKASHIPRLVLIQSKTVVTLAYTPG